MTGPLPIVMAAVMGATALYCAGRLAVAPFTDRASDRSADILHVVMGAVMAATLLGVLNRRWDLVWVLGFVVAALWFLRGAVVAAAGFGRRALWSEPESRHRLQHGAGCLAMVVMLVGGATPYAAASAAPQAAGRPGMAGMSTLAGGSTVLVALLVVTLVFGVVALAAGDLRLVTVVGPAQRGRPGRPMLAPRCAAGCRVAMGLTMGLALLSML